MKTKWSIQKLIYTGMLAAVAGAFVPLEFSVPMMLPFYRIDFSGVPSVIALPLLGSAPAAWMEIIKIIIELITVDTNSMCVREFVNLIGAVLFIIPTWAVYGRDGKTCRAAVAPLTVSIPIRTLFVCLCNASIILPLCATAMGLPLNRAATMVAVVDSAVSSLTTFIFMAITLFNLIKLGLNCFVGYLLYTRLLAVYPVTRTTRGNT